MASNVSREKLLFYAAAGARWRLRRMGAVGANSRHPLGLWPRYPVRCVDRRTNQRVSRLDRNAQRRPVAPGGAQIRGRRSYRRGGRSAGIAGRRICVRRPGRSQWPNSGMGRARNRGRTRRWIGVGIRGAAAQWRYRRRARRSARWIFLPEPDDHVSAGVRTSDRDHHPRRADRILHRTGRPSCSSAAG